MPTQHLPSATPATQNMANPQSTSSHPSAPVVQPPPSPTTRLRIAEDALERRDFERCRIICTNLVRLPGLHPVLKARAYLILGSISMPHEAVEHLRDAVKTAEEFKEGPGVKEFEVLRDGIKEALRQAELLANA